jgi:hypothetical protein
MTILIFYFVLLAGFALFICLQHLQICELRKQIAVLK